MQDTPAIKITYEAKITVDSDFKVFMSANETKVEDVPGGKQRAFYFEN